MNLKLSGTLFAVVLLSSLFHSLPSCLADNYSGSYQVLDNPAGSTYYQMKIEVSPSLLEYYQENSHRLGSNLDFARFVTPYAVKPLAGCLWEIYTDEEDFANGVLMIVHQIPYMETLPVKYPVETIVEDEGDCDLFSCLAASILKAGGLDVVLLYYEEEAHMNLGIHLSEAPHDARDQASFVDYNDVPYYVAECTGGNWESGWRVGECPSNLKVSQVQIVTLEDCEQWAPGQVSASYETFVASSISLSVSSTQVIQGSTIRLSGQLLPHLPNENITVFVKVNNSPWALLRQVKTGTDGRFEYSWEAEIAGVYYIRASWSGDDGYAGSDSAIHQLIVLPFSFILLLAITLMLIFLGIIAFLASRQGRSEIQEPQPPEMPL